MKPIIAIGLLSIVPSLLVPQYSFAQGSLTPPGAPAATMKSLDQIEPRTPILALPYSVSQSGSYYLTTNLVSTNAGYDISVNADNVTLDLNGFDLIGPGNGVGINMSGVGRSNICVKNGMVRNWFNGMDCSGVNIGLVERLRVTGNAGFGLAVGNNFAVTDCLTISNVLDGINCGNGCRIKDCVANSNARNGITCATACAVSGCLANGNGSSGISVSSSCYIFNNIASQNGAGVAGAGIRTSSVNNRIDGNHAIQNNGTGILSSSANADFITRNVSTGNTVTNYSPASGNNIGPIGQAGTATSPWANLQ